MFDSSTDNIDKKIKRRREVVFIVLAGIFLGSLAMLNILGVTRLLDLSFNIFGFEIPFIVFVGVLPYPITFLCTDFISELYGKKRAATVVWVGFIINIWVLFILWLGGVLPPSPEIVEGTNLPATDNPDFVFFRVRQLAFSATAASMIAYLTAQFVDVQVFHFLRRITKGKHLWLRNNGSTLTSQMVDSIAVVLITYYSNAIYIAEGENVTEKLLILVFSNYIFKMVSALIDTIPFYIGTYYLSKYLHVKPYSEYIKEKALKGEDIKDEQF